MGGPSGSRSLGPSHAFKSDLVTLHHIRDCLRQLLRKALPRVCVKVEIAQQYYLDTNRAMSIMALIGAIPFNCEGGLSIDKLSVVCYIDI